MDVSQLLSTLPTFILTFIVSFLVVKFYRRKSASVVNGLRRPPCLMALPVVGSLLFLKNRKGEPLHVQVTQLAEKLGSIFAFYSGSTYVVVLSDHEAIKNALVMKSTDFADRFPFFFDRFVSDELSRGIISGSYDDQYKRRRQFYLSTLKQFGFGHQMMESRIHVEVEELVTQARKLRGQPFDIRDMLSRCVLNVITSIVIGLRYDYDDPKLVEYWDAIRDVFAYNSPLLNIFPILRFVPYFRRRIRMKVYSVHRLQQLIERELEVSLRGEGAGGRESFIQQFIHHAEELRKSGKKESGYDRKEMICTVFDLMLGGADTSATSLRWMVALLADHVDLQNRIRRELDLVVPKSSGRLPCLSDADRLPFTQAFILEAMRYHTLAALGLPHATLRDTEVNGFFVPAKSLVLVNIFAAHMDRNKWNDPENFRPERFLNESDKVVGKENILSFSLGRRSCIGELLARQEIFLFFTALVQNFEIRPPEGQKTVECHEVTELTTEPSPFQVRLLGRSPDRN